jgi:hypothetical protein
MAEIQMFRTERGLAEFVFFPVLVLFFAVISISDQKVGP